MKLPSQAKKVFTGIRYDVYHWEQEFFDGSERTYEMLKRKSSVNVLAIVNGKVIIMEQEQPRRPLYPSLPGGVIDGNETPAEAARRELLEETGYTCSELTEIACYNSSPHMDFDDYFFIAHGCTKVGEQKLDGGEKISVRLGTFEDLLQCARDIQFAVPPEFRHQLWEALLDENKKAQLKSELGLRSN